MESALVYWGYIGIMENRMETTLVYWCYIRIMENRMETTLVYEVLLGYWKMEWKLL